MYKLLIELRAHTKEIDKVISSISSYLNTGSIEFKDANIINSNISNIKELDIYTLLEAIFLSSSNSLKNVMLELEDKYRNLIYNWHTLPKDNVELNYEEELFIICESIDSLLSKDISGINLFCSRYLNIEVNNQFTGFEYEIIAKAHNKYHKSTKHYHNLLIKKEKAFNQQDTLAVLVLNMSTDEYIDSIDINDYVRNAIEEHFGEAEKDIIENYYEFIKIDHFNIYFVTKINFEKTNSSYYI